MKLVEESFIWEKSARTRAEPLGVSFAFGDSVATGGSVVALESAEHAATSRARPKRTGNTNLDNPMGYIILWLQSSHWH